MTATSALRSENGVGPVLLVGVIVWIFSGALFGDGTKIPSYPTGDTANYFAPARSFAAEQIRAGSLPLWNPHTFSGTPFVGVFQSSVFYPTMWLHLALPLGRALTLEFVLNLTFFALLVFAWLRRWGLHWIACCFGALVATLGGTCMLRVFAGQLSVLATFTWVPLVLTAVDRLAERPSTGWVGVGILGTALMILAGHPPTALMAGLAIALYCATVLPGCKARVRLLVCLACIPVGACFLAAVQLWTGLEVALEGARGQGLSYGAATMFSMPPENLLTLVAPDLFGDRPAFGYYGRSWYWDASAFVGCAALALSIHGAFTSRGRLRNASLFLIVVSTGVAIGRHTPLYGLLYDAIPGISLMRAPSKFMFFACLFVAALAAVGADQLLREGREGRGDRRAAILAAGLTAVFGCLALWQWAATAEGVSFEAPTHLLASLQGAGSPSAAAAERWSQIASESLVRTAGVLAVSTVLLWLAPRRRWAVLLLMLVGLVELMAFAQRNHGTTSVADPLGRRPELRRAYAMAGENRVLETRLATNYAMVAKGYNVWGYDPLFLRRYGEFIAFTQGLGVEAFDNNGGRQPDRFHPLLSMLRVETQSGPEPIRHEGALPRAFLVGRHRTLETPEAVLAAMAAPDFDPRTEAILERPPRPEPDPTGAVSGAVRLLDESSDRLDLEVETARRAILIVTDAYASGWQARPLPGSTQTSYTVQRANAVLRAVPLEAGSHRLALEYTPAAFRAGAWASAISGALLMAVAGWRARRHWTAGRARAAAVSLALLCVPGWIGCKPPARPNVLVYVVDTLRADGLEPYDSRVLTPAAARLAREGVLYERAYAHSSWTRPSITSILTGQRPDEHAVETRTSIASPSLRFLSEAFSESGYATAAIITNPNVGAFFGFDQGYDDFIELFAGHQKAGVVQPGKARARSDEVTERAIEWIDGAPRPFFLFVLASDPHSPYEPPASFDCPASRGPAPRGPRYLGWGNVEEQRSRYQCEIAFNDASFGRLLDHIREAGLYDETVVVLSSDHGEEFGDHGHRWHGKTLFEEQVRVPLIIRRPREPQPGRRVETPVQLVDLHPTLLEAAGIPRTSALPGRTLPPDPGAEAPPIYARLELDGYSTEMLFAHPWKWIVSHAQPRREKRELGGLFNLEADPFEATDERNDRPEVAARLRSLLESQRATEPETSAAATAEPEALPANVREALEVLGYLDAGADDGPGATDTAGSPEQP